MMGLVWHISNTTEKTTRFQVAIILSINQFPKYLYQ